MFSVSQTICIANGSPAAYLSPISNTSCPSLYLSHIRRKCWQHVRHSHQTFSGNGKSEEMGKRHASPVSLDATPSFFIKLAAYSLAGSLAIKYGSLVIDVPFQPSFRVALSLIFGPTLLFSLFLAKLSWSDEAASRR